MLYEIAMDSGFDHKMQIINLPVGFIGILY